MLETYAQSVSNDPLLVLAPIASLIVSYVLFYEGFIYSIGNDSGFWKRIRNWLPMIDDEARDVGFYTTYTISEGEFVGTLHMSIADARKLFLDLGAMKNPLAAHKEDWEGRREVASLGFYDDYKAGEIESWSKIKRFVMMTFVVKKQLHVTLFWDEESESVVVTAHHEYSPYNVFYAYAHLRAKNYNVEKGVRMTKDKLTDVKRFEVGEDVSR